MDELELERTFLVKDLVDDDASEMMEYTIELTAEEYEVLCGCSKKRVVKKRYFAKIVDMMRKWMCLVRIWRGKSMRILRGSWRSIIRLCHRLTSHLYP